MVSLELPDKLAYDILTKELGNYRILYIKETKAYTLIHIDDMSFDDSDGKVNANISQVELNDKDREDIKEWFIGSEDLTTEAFHDIDISKAPIEDEDSIRRLNAILLRLCTIFDVSEFKVSKSYDTELRIQ